MRITIIRDDGVVGIGGVFRQVDLSSLPAGIRAVQWNGANGHIEYDDSENEDLAGIAWLQPFIDLWTAAAPPPSAPPTPSELKAAALDRINTAYQTAVNSMTSGYPEEEVKSWPKQEEEARAWLADPNNASTPWIDGAIASRGIAKADFVNLIIANANAFAPLHGELTGKRQALRDQINAFGDDVTQAQLDAIQW